MMYVSTGSAAPAVQIGTAIRRGAAPDRGLYVPQSLPTLDPSSLPADGDFSDFAEALLTPFFDEDPLAAELPAICAEAFNFPVPLVTPRPGQSGLRVLELFHGPTGAFKDFGARFLAGCFDRISVRSDPLTVLVATSGDTGGAVGCAVEDRKAIRAFILYPRGRISRFQELQLTCWRPPVQALEVEGDFDDCQRLVKEAFARREPALANLTSANSINIARLLPQLVYYAATALRIFAEEGRKPGFIIPTGNLGHGVAALYARAMGAPIGPIIASTNANRTLADWRHTGAYAPRSSVATIANAMDVGAPSNFDRLMNLSPDLREIEVETVEDEAIRVRIRIEHEESGYIWCPHGATAAETYARLDQIRREERCWVAVGTAHPFKFAEIVEPLIGRPVAPPAALAEILARPSRRTAISPTVESLLNAIHASAL